MLEDTKKESLRLHFELPSFQLPAELPSDPAALKGLLGQLYRTLEDTRHQALAHVNHLYEEIVLMRRRQFGASSEQMPGQSWLFNEAEVLAMPRPPEAAEFDSADQGEKSDLNKDASASQGADKPRRGGRAALPSELPRVDIVHDVPESERVCACGTPMVVIGEEVSEQLDIVPMKIQVLRHIRRRYGCPAGEHAPVSAALPAQPLPKTNASPDLLAMLLTVKYVDGLPLARFEHVLKRSGVTVPRQTLARWVIGTAERLQPVLNLLRDEVFEADLLHMDETVVQVNKEPGRAASSQSYMWVHSGGPPGRPVVIYDYDPGRGAAVPSRLLAGWRGHLMTDDYAGYDQVVRTESITHLACWAHVRRRFVEAVAVQPKGKRGRADQAVELIGKLYRVERDAAKLTDAGRLELREQRSRPLLKEIRTWLDAALPAVAPKTALGKALAYAHALWPRLIHYVERGDLPIDNNRAENAIRPFVVGRKAWMFSDTQAGARASAMIYSLVETAKANSIDPYSWLRLLARRVPAATSLEDYVALLPWNLHDSNLAIPFHV